MVYGNREGWDRGDGGWGQRLKLSSTDFIDCPFFVPSALPLLSPPPHSDTRHPQLFKLKALYSPPPHPTPPHALPSQKEDEDETNSHPQKFECEKHMGGLHVSAQPFVVVLRLFHTQAALSYPLILQYFFIYIYFPFFLHSPFYLTCSRTEGWTPSCAPCLRIHSLLLLFCCLMTRLRSHPKQPSRTRATYTTQSQRNTNFIHIRARGVPQRSAPTPRAHSFQCV